MIVGSARTQHPDRSALRIHGRDDGAPGLRQVEVVGATVGSAVSRNDRTRLTRKVRCPAAVSATRYQVLFFTTSPSGSTVRDEVRPSRPL